MAINKTVLHVKMDGFTISVFGLETIAFNETVPECLRLEGIDPYRQEVLGVYKASEEYLSPPSYRRVREKTMMESAELFSEFNAVFEPKRQPMMRAKNGKGKKK